MKKIFLLVTAILIISNSIFSQNTYVYNIDSIRNFDLSFYDAAWRDSLDTFYVHNLDNMVLATLKINGETFDSVGVRWKGNSSCSPGQIKNPMHIELDYIINQDYHGVETFKLSNLFKEPSFTREVTMYDFLSWYMPAPKTNYVNVYIDGNLLGFYTSSSSINKDFVLEHFGSDNNSRFKCDPASFSGSPTPIPGCPPIPPDIMSALGPMGPDTACYVNNYEIKSDYGWGKLEKLIFTVNFDSLNTYKYLDIDRTLWMLAFDNIFVNLDSYIGSGHNYYIYENDSNRFNPIIWDLNEIFGTFQQGMSFTQLKNLDLFYNINNQSRPLISKLLSIPEYKKKYLAHYRTIVKELIETDTIINRVSQLQTIIDSYVNADPNKLTSYNDFQNSLTADVGLAMGIQPFLTDRYNYITSDINYNKIAPVISAVTQVTQNPTDTNYVSITANVSNSTSCKLGYRSNSFDPFILIDMFDDGNHNDSTAGDGIYGAYIPPFPATTQVDYYVYAENNDAGIFSPVRAEYEFYNYTVTGDNITPGSIVINEFMASNSNTVTDQNGDFDDWIELYNTTSSDINLSEVYLSDKTTDIFKWKFPDTVITANNYLIIWADNSTNEAGLHSNFKLSASGESVILSNYDSTTIDIINFGTQHTDTSYGRYPNATGNFQFLQPTFSAYNQQLSIESINYADYIKLYPNPAKDFIFVEYKNIIKDTKYKIVIYNMLSQKIKTYDIDKNNNKISINTSAFKNGIYFIKFGNYAEKIIINR